MGHSPENCNYFFPLFRIRPCIIVVRAEMPPEGEKMVATTVTVTSPPVVLGGTSTLQVWVEAVVKAEATAAAKKKAPKYGFKVPA